MSGKNEEALRSERSLLIHDGKVAIYSGILSALIAGKEPVVPKGNPLELMRWKRGSGGPKENSIPGKILQRLRKGRAGREELIHLVWGEGARHPSYAARLYTAIKDLRGKYGIPVEFDGAEYRLIDL